MCKYRKKPVIIDAFIFAEASAEAVDWFAKAIDDKIVTNIVSGSDGKPISCVIKTLEGDMVARKGDYIIKGVQGEIYPCKANIFEETYDKVSEE